MHMVKQTYISLWQTTMFWVYLKPNIRNFLVKRAVRIIRWFRLSPVAGWWRKFHTCGHIVISTRFTSHDRRPPNYPDIRTTPAFSSVHTWAAKRDSLVTSCAFRLWRPLSCSHEIAQIGTILKEICKKRPGRLEKRSHVTF